MLLGAGFIITSTQTDSLNQLPKKDAADGVVVLNTISQIAAAFGSSVFIGILSTVQSKKLQGLSDPSTGIQSQAMVEGFNSTFILAAIGLMLALFIKRQYIKGDNMKM